MYSRALPTDVFDSNGHNDVKILYFPLYGPSSIIKNTQPSDQVDGCVAINCKFVMLKTFVS